MRELGTAIVSRLAKSLRAHAGLELPAWVIASRAGARMEVVGMDAHAYALHIDAPNGAAELAALVEAVRVGETRFFRHEKQTDAVVDVVLPAWRDEGVTSPRIWSAGCASGEEPYTLALVLSTLFRGSGTPSILATDVSAEAIAFAKRGAYPSSALERVPEPYRRGFVVQGSRMRVREDVAAMVTFQRQNLAGSSQPRGFHLVWCRNVLIYFEPDARRAAVAKLVDALAPGGFLFLGYSETLRGTEGLETVRYGEQIVFRKPKDLSGTPLKPAQRRPKALGHRVAKTQAKETPVASPTTHGAPPSSRSRKHAATVTIDPSDQGGLQRDIQRALAHRSLGSVTIDLDAAPFIDDEVAPILRRAQAAAKAAGIALVLRAERPGAQRWLRRNGLPDGGA